MAMLVRYELTKPAELQVSAAIRKRNRTKFRWGTIIAKRSAKPEPNSASGAPLPNPHANPHANSSRRSGRTASKPLQPLPRIDESELEDCASDEDTSPSTDSSFASSTASSESTGTSPFMPRIEYNLRKLLREVMGLDSVWASDHQVARHYAHMDWTVVPIAADGNCLFRAISDQLYGSEIYHGDIRRVRLCFAHVGRDVRLTHY